MQEFIQPFLAAVHPSSFRSRWFGDATKAVGCWGEPPGCCQHCSCCKGKTNARVWGLSSSEGGCSEPCCSLLTATLSFLSAGCLAVRLAWVPPLHSQSHQVRGHEEERQTASVACVFRVASLSSSFWVSPSGAVLNEIKPSNNAGRGQCLCTLAVSPGTPVGDSLPSNSLKKPVAQGGFVAGFTVNNQHPIQPQICLSMCKFVLPLKYDSGLLQCTAFSVCMWCCVCVKHCLH